jgi:hypothetical protein
MPVEVTVAAADSEAVAAVFAGRLRVEGIQARVFYDSQAGIPPQIAPSGLGFGPGAFRVAVAERDAGRARQLLADAESAPVRSRPLLRAIAAVLLIGVFLSWIAGAIELLRAAFSR